MNIAVADEGRNIVVGAIGVSGVAAIRAMPSRQLAPLHFNDVTMAGH